LFTINYGTIQVLKWIVAGIEHWNWLLKNYKFNVETKRHKEYEKQPLKVLRSTTRFGYVPISRKKIFQDYRCWDANSHWMMGIF
jgi:hypothetical protein